MSLNPHCRTVGPPTGHADPMRVLAVVLAVVIVCSLCPGSVFAAGTASSFQLTGGTLVGGSGTLTSGSYVMNGTLSQPSPTGTAAGTGAILTSGSEPPSVVIEILRFTLSAGWSLRGAPGTTQESVGEIFTGSGGSPVKVGGLYFYDTDTGAYSMSTDSDMLPANEAFWVFSYWGGTGSEFSVGEEGTLMSEWVDNLPDGWSLFSPSTSGRIPNDERLVSVWKWNTASGSYTELQPGDLLQMLEGFWILKDSGD